MSTFTIDADIRRASTLPSEVYHDDLWFERARTRLFPKTWQFVGDTDALKTPSHVKPGTLLEGFLDEPIVFTRDAEDRLHCLSNVCTHRGNILVPGEGHAQSLRCRYHGRRFTLDGRFAAMPEFEGAIDFPSPADDLPRVPFGQLDKLLFASLEPVKPLEELLAPIASRIGWMPIKEAALDATRVRHYLVRANWALYCDNYLEGFHIPFVHASLARAIDYGAYTTEVFPHGSVQIAVAATGGDAFALPVGSPDYGQSIAAYYYWLFPNTMLNIYPWGISINVVAPLAPDRTRVSFLPYVWDASKLDQGAGAGLDRVEREDEAVVEGVQKGIRSRLYRRGRYSPSREIGVHHFHRLLAEFLSD